MPGTSASNHYDVAVIGAGMSGLAAAIRLAYYGKKVIVVERHRVAGGLNSYYTKQGRPLEVGLHAMTNFAGPADRMLPLNKLLRQLKLKHGELDLVPQTHSLIRFPGATLRFTNDPAALRESVREAFPNEIDGFVRLEAKVTGWDALALDRAGFVSARDVLAEYLADPLLVDMLLCPLLYYGSSWEGDMDFSQFVIMFRSIFGEGFCRPAGGVRALIDLLTRKLTESGGRLLFRAGVRKIRVEDGGATGLYLETGELVQADRVLSTAGLPETELLAGMPLVEGEAGPGDLAFTELILALDRPLSDHGLDATIVFHGAESRFQYRRPDAFADFGSAVLCCPDNFAWGDRPRHWPCLRVTNLADWKRWCALPDEAYKAEKKVQEERIIDFACAATPLRREWIQFTDLFTPRTVIRYTARENGAVYGSRRKVKDGATRVANLFLCGTDQGFLGIVGSMLSGVSIANLHLLR